MLNFFKKSFILLTTITIASLSTIQAQNCKIVKEKKDPFTNEVVRVATIDIPKNSQFIIQGSGNEYSVGLNIYQSGQVPEQLSQGSKILVKLENSEIIELVLDKDYIPVHKVGFNVDGTNWNVLVKIDKKDFIKFGKSLITAIQFIIQQDKKLLEINTRASGKIMDAAQCILQGQ